MSSGTKSVPAIKKRNLGANPSLHSGHSGTQLTSATKERIDSITKNVLKSQRMNTDNSDTMDQRNQSVAAASDE